MNSPFDEYAYDTPPPLQSPPPPPPPPPPSPSSLPSSYIYRRPIYQHQQQHHYQQAYVWRNSTESLNAYDLAVSNIGRSSRLRSSSIMSGSPIEDYSNSSESPEGQGNGAAKLRMMPKILPDGRVKLNARQRRTLRRAIERQRKAQNLSVVPIPISNSPLLFSQQDIHQAALSVKEVLGEKIEQKIVNRIAKEILLCIIRKDNEELSGVQEQ
eukprot:TRINITY_DN10265_c0_g1_i1.p2 TRINITY_DN10265_c0_g1~~TRINITY_DN10265_c0_g1_i1.p2  ORF type:complete len:224 (-),score=19.96 TRINITY_DN10265_c0_g1_i1:202-837(-)